MSHVLWAQGSTRSALGYRVHRGPDVSVHYSTTAAGPAPKTFSLTRDKETLQTLNGRLQVYLNQVQSLESTNQRLEQQIREELDRKYPRHLRGRDHDLRGPDHDLRGPDHDLRTASHLQNQICRCLSVQSELKLKLLGAELTVVDVKDRLDREHEHRRRLEAELMDLKAFWEELKNHHLPELQGRINTRTQQLTELKTQHHQDLQGLLVEGSEDVTVKMKDVQTSDLNQQLNRQRNVRRFNVQVSMMDPPEEPLRPSGGSEVAELMVLKKSLGNLETELNQLQAVNVMMEASTLQKSQMYVLQLGVLQQRADVLCSDLDSVLQAAAQKAKDHTALLDVKNQLEAEIQDYKRLLDGLNIQRVSNSNPTSFHNAFIPARRNIPVRVQREKVALAAGQPVSRGHTGLSRPQHLETVTRCQPVKHLHGSPTVEEVSFPSAKSQNVAGRQDKKRLELQQEGPESGQVVSSRLVDSVETGRDGDEGPTAVFDRNGSDVCKSVVSQGNVSVEEKVQVLRLDQRSLLSDVSLSKKVTKNRDSGLGSGRPEELQSVKKTGVSESRVTHTPRTELRPPSVEGQEIETVVLASGSEDSQVSSEVDEKEKNEQEKMEEEEKVRLDGIPHGVRLDLSSQSDVSMIKQVTESESGTSADLQTNTRTGVSGTRDLLDAQREICLSQTMKTETKEAVAEKDKNVKEKKVEEVDVEGPSLRFDQSSSDSSDIKQSQVAESGSQSMTSRTYTSTKTLNEVQMKKGFNGNKEVEQVSIEGPSSCGRDIRGSLKGQLIGTKDKVREEADSGSGRPADIQTNIGTSISGTRNLLIGVVILPETSRMDEKMRRQEKKDGDKQVVVGVRSHDGGTGSGSPAEQETRTHLHADIGLQESGAPAGVQVITETPAVIESLSNEISEKEERIQQGTKGEEKWVVVGGSSDDADSGSGRPEELQRVTKTGVSDRSVTHTPRTELRPPSVERQDIETVVLASGSEDSQVSSEVDEKEKNEQEKMEEEEKVRLDGIPHGVRLDLSSQSDVSMIKQVTESESGTSADLQTNTRTGVSGTRDLLDAQREICLSQTMNTETKEAVAEKDKNVKEKKVEEVDVEGPSLRFDQSSSDSSDIKQSQVTKSGSQSRSTTTKILNEAKVHEGIPDSGFHNTNDLKTCPSEVVSEVEAQTGQDAKEPLSLTDSGGVGVSSSEPEPDVDPVLRIKEVEIDLNTVDTEEFLMDEVFCPVDLKDHLELLLDPSDSEMFLFQHDSEMCPNDEDDDDEFCLTEASVNVRPVEKYILSTKESQLLCLSGGGALSDEDRNVTVSVDVGNTFGSFVGNERDSALGEGTITDKEDQLGFGSDRNSGNACGFPDKVLGPGVIEGVNVNHGNVDTTAGFDGKAAKPSGRVSGNVGSFSQTNTGRRDGHFLTTVPSVQTVRVGGRVGGEQMVYGGQPARMSSGAGRSSVNSAESRESPLVAKQLPTSPQGAARFGRRGSGDWTVHGGPAGGGTNHPSSALPVVGSKSESSHLPTSPLEKGRIGRRDSGEWVLYDRNRLQSAESEGSSPVVTQLPTSPQGPGRFCRKGSGEHVLYGGSLIRRNSFDGTWVEGGPSSVTNPPEPWFGRRGSGEGVVYGGQQRTRSSEIEQFQTESPHPVSPPGAVRFNRKDSGDWVVYGRSEERTPVIRQRATSSSGAPRVGRFSNEEDREQKVYGTNPGGVVRRSGSVGSGSKLTKSSSSGGLSSNRRSSVGSVGRPGGGAIISSNRAPSPGGRMSFSGGSGGWLSSSTAATKHISRAGSSDRLSTGRVRSSSVSSGGGGRVITSSSRSTGSATGSRSNRDRVSVCKRAAMLMSEAGKERSHDQQRRHQTEADDASAAVQRWLTSGDLGAEADRPDGIA